jgi:hypothetical protein
MLSEREKKEIDYGLYNKNNSISNSICCKTLVRSVDMRMSTTISDLETKGGIEWTYDVFGEEINSHPLGSKLVVLGACTHGYSSDSPVPLLIKSNHFKNDCYSSFCFCFLGIEHNPIYKSLNTVCCSKSNKCCGFDKTYFKKLERMKKYSDKFVKTKDAYLKEVKDLNLYVVKDARVVSDLLKLKEFDALFSKKVVYIAKISKYGKFREANQETDQIFEESDIIDVEEEEDEEEEEDQINDSRMNSKEEVEDEESTSQKEESDNESEQEEEEEFDVLDEPKEIVKSQKKSQSKSMEQSQQTTITMEKQDKSLDEIKSLLGENSLCIDISKFETFRKWISNERFPIIDDKLKFKVFIPSKFTGISIDQYLEKSDVKSGDFEKMKKMKINVQVDMTLTVAYV